MLKAFISSFSIDLSRCGNTGIELTIHIPKQESPETQAEYEEFWGAYGMGAVPSEMPILEVRIEKEK